LQTSRSHKSPSAGKRFTFPLPVLVCLGVSALLVFVFLRIVDLKPKVDETFFFSKQDRQLKADNQIDKIFPEPPRIILGVAGDIQSPAYAERIRALSNDLTNLPGVLSLQSLSRGPKDLDDALKSPLWSRLLIAENRKATYILVTLRKSAEEATIQQVEALQRRFDRPPFRVMISGVPYVNELIARNLTRDLRVFSLAAIGVFGVVLFVIFRSPWIVLGTFVACADSSACTLIATQLIHIPIGPLTANLSTMVFVMTLSPMVFLTFN